MSGTFPMDHPVRVSARGQAHRVGRPPRVLVLPPTFRTRLYALLLALIAAGVLASFAGASQVTAAAPLDTEEQRALDLINAARAQQGLPELVVSPTLQDAAQWMAADLAQVGALNHTDSLGRDIRARFSAFGYPAPSVIRENIGVGYPDGQAAYQGWVDSPPHYANLLADDVRAAGLAWVSASSSGEYWYWVLTLGSEVDAATLPATLPQPTTNLGGSVPDEGIGVLVAQEPATPESVVTTLNSGGCAALSIWVTLDGVMLGYRRGAPAFVNAGFPPSISAGTPFIAVCA